MMFEFLRTSPEKKRAKELRNLIGTLEGIIDRERSRFSKSSSFEIDMYFRFSMDEERRIALQQAMDSLPVLRKQLAELERR